MAIANGMAKSNPLHDVNKLRTNNKLERHLSKEEEERIFMACDQDYSFLNISAKEQEKLRNKYHFSYSYLKPILLMALNTGMRKSEILNLKWICVNFVENEICILDPKNGKKHSVPMSKVLREVLEKKYKTEFENEYVFTNPETGTKYNDIKKAFKTVCKIAQVENFRFHDLRHTSATRMVQACVPINVVQKILNHASVTTTMRYSHTMREQEQNAVELLSSYSVA